MLCLKGFGDPPSALFFELCFAVFCSFSVCFDLRFVRKIDQNAPEYHGFESPEAHLCGSSGDLEIAYKPVGKKDDF